MYTVCFSALCVRKILGKKWKQNRKMIIKIIIILISLLATGGVEHKNRMNNKIAITINKKILTTKIPNKKGFFTGKTEEPHKP